MKIARLGSAVAMIGFAVALSADAVAQGIGIELYQNLVSREPKVTLPTERVFYGKELAQFGDLRIPKGAGPQLPPSPLSQ